MGGVKEWMALLSPCSPFVIVFIVLIVIAICYMAIPDIDATGSWFMLVLFTVLASIPDKDMDYI